MLALENLTLVSAGDRIREGSLSVAELNGMVLDRIRVLNERMGVFIAVAREIPVENCPPGPLHGLPISLKDLIDAQGFSTTAGSLLFADRRPTEDARVVSKLRGAGAVLIGKTNLHEFAYGVTGVNPHYGPSRNPWNPDRMSGGSSGGSASSVILSMALGSVGTDTGGSVRIPAALCGAVGLKPTYGLVSTVGVLPLAPSFDHVGPLARTVRDAAVMLEVMAESQEAYGSQLEGGIQGLKFGIPATMFDRLDSEVRDRTEAALRVLEKLGGMLVDVELPGPIENEQVFKTIAGSEVLAFHARYLTESPERYSAEIRGRMQAAASVTESDYLLGQKKRNVFRQQTAKVFEAVDLVAGPTVPIPAPLLDATEVVVDGVSEPVLSALTRNTRLFSTIGVPSVSVPCGFTSENLPVGLQIAGPAFAESLVLRAAHAYEQEAGWFSCRPPV